MFGNQPTAQFCSVAKPKKRMIELLGWTRACTATNHHGFGDHCSATAQGRRGWKHTGQLTAQTQRKQPLSPIRLVRPEACAPARHLSHGARARAASAPGPRVRRAGAQRRTSSCREISSNCCCQARSVLVVRGGAAAARGGAGSSSGCASRTAPSFCRRAGAARGLPAAPARTWAGVARLRCRPRAALQLHAVDEALLQPRVWRSQSSTAARCRGGL